MANRDIQDGDYATFKAFFDGRQKRNDYRPVSNNTRIEPRWFHKEQDPRFTPEQSEPFLVFRLYSTDIYGVHPDGRWFVNIGGWDTQTTTSWLDRLMPVNYRFNLNESWRPLVGRNACHRLRRFRGDETGVALDTVATYGRDNVLLDDPTQPEQQYVYMTLKDSAGRRAFLSKLRKLVRSDEVATMFWVCGETVKAGGSLTAFTDDLSAQVRERAVAVTARMGKGRGKLAQVERQSARALIAGNMRFNLTSTRGLIAAAMLAVSTGDSELATLLCKAGVTCPDMMLSPMFFKNVDATRAISDWFACVVTQLNNVESRFGRQSSQGLAELVFMPYRLETHRVHVKDMEDVRENARLGQLPRQADALHRAIVITNDWFLASPAKGK